MEYKRSSVFILTAVIAITLIPSVLGCSASTAAKARDLVKPGMSLEQVITGTRGWWAVIVSNPSAKEKQETFSLIGSDDAVPSLKEDTGWSKGQDVSTRAKAAAVMQKHMFNGRTSQWNVFFSFLGTPRSGFAVTFNAQGKVDKVGEILTND